MAIDEVLDEHEQSERVREWLRRNAFGMVAGVVIALALIGGWRWWQGQQHQQRVAAGGEYQTVLDALAAGDLDQAQARANAIRSGSYGTLAALDLAKAQFDAGHLDEAISVLRGAEGSDAALDAIRRQRLAQLLIQDGQAQAAIDALAGLDDAASREMLGDAHFAADDRDAARQAYGEALQHLEAGSPQRRLVALKLTEVGGSPEQPEATP